MYLHRPRVRKEPDFGHAGHDAVQHFAARGAEDEGLIAQREQGRPGAVPNRALAHGVDAGDGDDEAVLAGARAFDLGSGCVG